MNDKMGFGYPDDGFGVSFQNFNKPIPPPFRSSCQEGYPLVTPQDDKCVAVTLVVGDKVDGGIKMFYASGM